MVNFYKALGWFFDFLNVLLFARIIISIIVLMSKKDLKIFGIVYFLTEPILAPIRNLLNKSEYLRNSPFDFSVLFAFLIIGLIKSILPY